MSYNYMIMKLSLNNLLISSTIILSVFMANTAYPSADPGSLIRLIESRRSIRAFKKDMVDIEVLKKIVNSARFAPSAMNRQPWEFIIVDDNALKGQIFGSIAMLAGSTPDKDQQAPAYIVVLGDPKISKGYMADCAFATSNILNVAWAYGLGTCVIGSMDEKKIKELLNIPRGHDICWLIQIGYPVETPIAVDSADGGTKRSKDASGNFIVPKKKLGSILHINGWGKQ